MKLNAGHQRDTETEMTVRRCGCWGRRLVRLTNIHQVVVDTFHRDHLQEVVLVVSLLGHLGAVGVVFEEVVEELGKERSHLSRPGRLIGCREPG